MNRNISIIKRVFFILLLFVLPLITNAEPYKPYPILFVHGIGSGSGTWGAPVENREISDSIPKDSLESGHTYAHFLDYMTKYAWAWYDWEKEQGLPRTYTPDPDAPVTGPRFPNKTFLEVINFDEFPLENVGMRAVGSIDPDFNNSNPLWRYRGEGQELYERVVEVMEEYYGENWGNNKNAKIIFVAHSGGGLAVRECIYEHPELKSHIAKVITLGSPHTGCEITKIKTYLKISEYVEGVSYLVLAFCGQVVLGLIEYAAAALSVIVENFGKGYGLYTPMGEDATPGSTLLEKLNDHDNFQGGAYSWHCLVGRGGYNLVPIGQILTTGGLLMIAMGIFPPNPWLLLVGGQLVAKGGFCWWLGSNTDGLMATWNANINYADSRYKAEVRTLYPLSHTDQPKKWKRILYFIEEPPSFYWDTLFASKFVIDSLTQDTIFMDTVFDLGNENPELGTYKPDSISGKIYNYFLAECQIDLHLNIMNWDPLTWENGDFGRNGNRFVIKDLMERGVFPGWNKLKATAVNMHDQKATDKIRFFYNPFLTYLEFKAPLDEDCFQSSVDTAAVVYFSDNRSPLQAESLSVIFEDNVILDTAVVYSEEDSVFQDTLRVSFSPISPLQEGMYLVKAVVRNTSKGSKPAKSINTFYIDDTPPEPLIAIPLGEDSVVHSSRVENFMPLVFTISDNLDTVIYTPKNEEAFVEIRDSADNLVWRDTIGTDTIQAGCYYNLPKRIYWDFQDLDGEKVLNSGKYNIIISCLDKAGNLELWG